MAIYYGDLMGKYGESEIPLLQMGPNFRVKADRKVADFGLGESSAQMACPNGRFVSYKTCPEDRDGPR